jgi:hypothetical protein
MKDTHHTGVRHNSGQTIQHHLPLNSHWHNWAAAEPVKRSLITYDH